MLSTTGAAVPSACWYVAELFVASTTTGPSENPVVDALAAVFVLIVFIVVLPDVAALTVSITGLIFAAVVEVVEVVEEVEEVDEVDVDMEEEVELVEGVVVVVVEEDVEEVEVVVVEASVGFVTGLTVTAAAEALVDEAHGGRVEAIVVSPPAQQI